MINDQFWKIIHTLIMKTLLISVLNQSIGVEFCCVSVWGFAGCFCYNDSVAVLEQRQSLLGLCQAWMAGRCDGHAGWCRRSRTTRAWISPWISPEQVSHSSLPGCMLLQDRPVHSPKLSAMCTYHSVSGWVTWRISSIIMDGFIFYHNIDMFYDILKTLEKRNE